MRTNWRANTIKFQILIYYYDDTSLQQYLKWFRYIDETAKVTKCRNEWLYESEHFIIRCIRGVNESSRGLRAHFVAVQEELTWRENWNEIKNCILSPMLLSPIDIQIFDSAIGGAHERNKEV